MMTATRLIGHLDADCFYVSCEPVRHPFLRGQPLAEAARSLQRRVLDEVELPVSIGIAPSKALCKLASDAARPLGCAVLTEDRAIEALLRRQPVEEISGIVERSCRKLAAHDILTCWDFAQADRRLLTVKGEVLWWELRGQAVTPLETTRPPHKCIGRGGSLGKTVTDPQRLSAWLVRNLERLIEALDHYQMVTDQLGLWLEFRTGEGGYARASLTQSTAGFEVLLPAAKRLLREVWRDRRPVSGMHLLAERLRFRHDVQASLFDRRDSRRERLAELKRLVNQIPRRLCSVRPGYLLTCEGLFC